MTPGLREFVMEAPAGDEGRSGARVRTGQAGRAAAAERPDGTPQAEQPVTGWQPRRPALELPTGPVWDRIMVLTRPRALLPVVSAVSTVSVTRLLNVDGKTVARLVEEHSTVTAAGTIAELPTRRAIAEVRGYPGTTPRPSSSATR
jgi:hypothetical protein